MKTRRTADVKTNPRAARSRRQAKIEIRKFFVIDDSKEEDEEASALSLEGVLENTA